PHGTTRRNRSVSAPQGIRPVDRPPAATRASRVAYGTARGGVGILGRGVQPDGRHARSGAEAEARGECGGAATHSHSAQNRIPHTTDGLRLTTGGSVERRRAPRGSRIRAKQGIVYA